MLNHWIIESLNHWIIRIIESLNHWICESLNNWIIESLNHWIFENIESLNHRIIEYSNTLNIRIIESLNNRKHWIIEYFLYFWKSTQKKRFVCMFMYNYNEVLFQFEMMFLFCTRLNKIIMLIVKSRKRCKWTNWAPKIRPVASLHMMIIWAYPISLSLIWLNRGYQVITHNIAGRIRYYNKASS